MTQGVYWKIDRKEHVERVFKHLKDWALAWDYSVPLVLQPDAYKNPRTLSQNSLMHIWFREIAQNLADRGQMVGDEKITPEDVKLMLKMKFLGLEDIIRGKLIIKDQLRSTSKLDKGELHFFLNQVEEWATDRGIMLSNPAGSEYMKLREAQNG